MIYLIRHAHALSRQRWEGDDSLRPLSARGVSQADALAALLEPVAPQTLLSSPALRCRTTLEPLATRLGAEVELDERLLEGASGRCCLTDLLARAAKGTVVACTHGDVIGEVLDLLLEQGTPLSSPPAMPKGGTWELTVSSGRVSGARLRPPPAV